MPSTDPALPMIDLPRGAFDGARHPPVRAAGTPVQPAHTAPGRSMAAAGAEVAPLNPAVAPLPTGAGHGG